MSMVNDNSIIPLVIAHRGASKIASENTLKAFQKAIDLKADFIEFDLRRSKDNQLVITHDEDLLRLTGINRMVSSLRLQDLKSLDFGEGEKIPTFEELIQLARDKIKLNCEITVPNIGEKVIENLEKYKMVDSTIISSFLHEELIKIKKLSPEIRVASLEPTPYVKKLDWVEKEQMVEYCIKNKFYAINPLVIMVDQKLVNYAHDFGIKVFPWTVNVKIAIKKLIKLGVDGIITDDIELLQTVINDFKRN
jgi:glycerophosphoryl diester phosphodiesterase